MKSPIAALFGSAIALAITTPVPAAAVNVTDDLELFGDVRLRYENDFEVTNTDGSDKDDRNRIRARARLGANYHLDGPHNFGMRVRTGDPRDHQSPHQTLGANMASGEINLDRAFYKFKQGSLTIVAGKAGVLFWGPHEMFWDDDNNPSGGAVAYDLADFGVNLNLGVYALSADEGWFEDGGARMIAGQAVVKVGPAKGALGLFDFTDDPTNVDSSGQFNTGLKGEDSTILAVNLQGQVAGVTLGADWYHNFEDSFADSATSSGEDGYVGYVQYGSTQPGKFLAAAYYVYIETHAVIATFAQDDWWRFNDGSITNKANTMSSNLEGFELRAAYGVAKGIDLVARYYNTEEIDPVSTAAGSEARESQRFRIDLNMKF